MRALVERNRFRMYFYNFFRFPSVLVNLTRKPTNSSYCDNPSNYIQISLTMCCNPKK